MRDEPRRYDHPRLPQRMSPLSRRPPSRDATRKCARTPPVRSRESQLRRRALPLRADARAPRQVHVARARERRARAGLDRPPRRVAGRVVDDEHLGARRGVRLRRDVRQAALEVAGPVEGDDGDADPRSRWYPDRFGRWRNGA